MFPSWYQSRLFLRKSDSLEPNDQWGMSTEDKRFCATESAFLSGQCLKSWWNLVEYQTVSFNWHRKRFCYYCFVSECTYQFCSVYMFTFSHTIYTFCVFRAKYSDLKNLFLLFFRPIYFGVLWVQKVVFRQYLVYLYVLQRPKHWTYLEKIHTHQTIILSLHKCTIHQSTPILVRNPPKSVSFLK